MFCYVRRRLSEDEKLS